jgi:hypothetical protein
MSVLLGTPRFGAEIFNCFFAQEFAGGYRFRRRWENPS